MYFLSSARENIKSLPSFKYPISLDMLLAGSDKKCQIFNIRLDIHYNAISHSI